MKKTKLIGTLILFVMFAVSASADAASQPLTLTTAQKKISVEFARLDGSLKKAAAELGKSGLTGDDARRVLLATCGEFSYAVDCSGVDPQGRMITVEPAQYRRFEGKDISDQEHVKRILKIRKPVLSQVFRSVEGFDAVDVEYPVFNSGGSFIGSVSVLFKPEKFLGDIIKPIVKGVPMDIWAMDKGGSILYDVDSSQIGLNLFTSPLYQPYTQLVNLGKKIAKTEHGSGSYRFKAFKTGLDANKKTYWQSVTLYGTSWRLVGIHVEPEAKEERAVRPVSAFNFDQALEKFAAEAALKAALADGKKDEGMKLLKRFYEATPGIYSVQWVDTKGINRFGYPVENSLSGYDFNSAKAPSDKETIQILQKQQPAAFEAPLFEGRTGAFLFKPVFKDGNYLGLLYSIKLKND